VDNGPLARTAAVLVIIAASVWLFQWVWVVATRFADILLLFLLAWLVSFVLGPLCRRLEQAGLNRASATATVYLGVVLLIAGGGVWGIPALIDQTVQLSTSLPDLASGLEIRAELVKGTLISYGIAEAALLDVSRAAIARAESVGTIILGNALSIATAILDGVVRSLFVLLFSFYIMLDGDRFGATIRTLAPSRYRNDLSSALDQVDRTFGGYVRSLLVQAIVYAVGNAAIMVVAKLPFVLVISILAGIAMLLPVIGPAIAVVPPLVLGLVSAPGSIWWIALSLLALQVAVANVLATRLMSKSVGVHPLVVFGAVLVGSRIGGPWGAVFGVPIAAILAILGRVLYERVVTKTPLFRSGSYRTVTRDPDELTPNTDPLGATGMQQ
jgi:predicted PurR-regulated permease PerM